MSEHIVAPHATGTQSMHRRRLLKSIVAVTLAPIVAQARGASAAPPSRPSRCVRVGTGPVALRAKPSLGGAVVTMAPACACGAMAPDASILADGFRWVRLTLDETGATGWVPTWHLAAIDV